MIRVTQLLHGAGTVSEAVKYRNRDPEGVPRRLVAFTETRRPVVFWNITRKCNLSCAHCYISAGPGDGGELTLEEAADFMADLKAMKIPLLMFTGGEPLMRDDFWQLAEIAAIAWAVALLGFAQHMDGEVTVLEGPVFRLRIAPENQAPAGFRLSALRLAMSRPSVMRASLSEAWSRISPRRSATRRSAPLAP